jgi:hypothetical protein
MPILTSLANRRPTSCKTCYVAGNSPLLSHWRQPAGCCSSINDEDDDLGLSIPPAFCKPPDPALVVSRSKGFHLTTGSSRAVSSLYLITDAHSALTATLFNFDYEPRPPGTIMSFTFSDEARSATELPGKEEDWTRLPTRVSKACERCRRHKSRVRCLLLRSGGPDLIRVIVLILHLVR